MAATPQDRKKPVEHVAELKELVVGYARQETVDPLKTLGRYLLWGVLGAVFMTGGSIFLMLGVTRLLQSMDPFQYDTGALSLVPYAVAIALGIVIIVLAVVAIMRGDPGRKEDSR